MNDLTERLDAARRRQRSYYFNGFIHAYCDNPECTGRRFQIQIKTYGADDPVSVCCPLCGIAAIADVFREAVETLDEYNTRADREARQSVNVQRYVKNHGIAVPANILFDDSLS